MIIYYIILYRKMWNVWLREITDTAPIVILMFDG